MHDADAENGAGLPVGEYLKSVRESRGIRLDDASRVTKIGKGYLVALEQGEFDKLPSAAYIKGFLRLYAGFLGLSGDEVIGMYEKSLPAASRNQVEHAAAHAAGHRVEVMDRPKAGGLGRWLIPALLLALVILAAIFFSEREPEQSVREVPPPAALPQVPVTSAVQPQLTSAAMVPGGAPLQVEPPLPAGEKPPGGIILRLRFNQDSWLSITIDESISQRYDLKAGDIVEWKGKRLFVVDIGDGGAAEAEFNGRPLKALGEPGKPAHVELKNE